MNTNVVILAAGQGTRMKSALPKVLHPLAGTPMLEHVYRAARHRQPARLCIVYGHGGQQLRERLAHLDAEWVEQAEQLGTGHAVAQAAPCFDDDAIVLILYGDVPLIAPATLDALAGSAAGTGFAMVTVTLPDPSGYGRIVRDAIGRVARIVEHKDAGDAERDIDEINTGFMAVRGDLLRRWLSEIGNDNAQGEYYLTDIVALAVRDDIEVATVEPGSVHEVSGVNDRVQLAELERVYQRAAAEALMRAGVTIADPARLDIRGSVECEPDVFIDVNCVLEGQVRLATGVRIGPGVCLANVSIGAGTEVLANSVLQDCEVGADARIGPFARLRPDTVLADRVHVGNFVEVKKTTVGPGSKINHLAYVGDAEIGAEVNVGAGTITCNYDGANKHLTVIGDRAFIGSDTQLVAPVTVGADATIGAGTTLTGNAPPGQLTLSRARQRSIEGWKRPVKGK